MSSPAASIKFCPYQDSANASTSFALSSDFVGVCSVNWIHPSHSTAR